MVARGRSEIFAVAQLHPLGCAVACVAALCGKSYDEALQLFEQPELAWTRGFYCSEVTAAISRTGLNYVFEPFDHKRNGALLKETGTIVFVGNCQAYPAGHFLLRSQNGWMNPWANFPKMMDVQARFEDQLPGEVTYVIAPTSDL